MKRRALFFMLLLVGGAIVNVALAWGCLGRMDNRTGVALPDDLLLPRIREVFGQSETYSKPVGTAFVSTGVRIEQVNATGSHGPYVRRERSDTWAGLPCKSVHAIWWADWPPAHTTGLWTFGVLESWTGRGMLPWRPIWPGFAINTVFYAAILWLLFAAPFALRRRRRVKRGLCPKCAYPVGSSWGSPVCTECGAAVTPNAIKADA